MNKPILFVDEKSEDKSDQYRFKKLEDRVKKHSYLIEFMGDLDLEYQYNKYTTEVEYTPSIYFDGRKIVFIHVSLDNPKYPNPVITKAKAYHRETLFVKFSGDRTPNLKLEDLSFKRNEAIYNFDKDGFKKFIAFYSQTGRFDFYLLEYGEDAFKQKENETNLAFDMIKRNIKNDEILKKRRGDANFMKIMRLADIYQDNERLQRGIEYINSLTHKEAYFLMLEKYVKKIIEQANADAETLKNLQV